ncbi:hypothetical protein AB0K40_39030 [Nonomuraea bangladeshensis]|uniref:FXSXX-COOH protein n=1 Tax=Nonomuraea bangladeshensis TaxID=404385 RepID=A0ABV3HG58_9ACTN|nr:hypothetical protein [Nonomuraea sp. LP-02]MED7930791.1 hypothetical protein [Nonomuraea sp. LP-02]
MSDRLLPKSVRVFHSEVRSAASARLSPASPVGQARIARPTPYVTAASSTSGKKIVEA